MESPVYALYDENGFAECIKNSGLRISFNHLMGKNAKDLTDIHLDEDGSLWQQDKEIMMFHFNHAKKWPCNS
jgi:hypothetical protein